MPYAYAGFENSMLGMNAAVAPALIGETEISKGINLDLRTGRPRSRPAFIKQTMNGDASVIEFIQNGRYQGGIIYNYAGVNYIAFGVFGRIFLFHPETFEVSEVTVGSGLSFAAERLYFCQVNEYLIIQDGVNRPMILTGFSGRFSTGGDNPAEPEVPVGTAMAFGQGRLFVVVDKKYIMAGDIYLPWDGDTVLKFTEIQYLSGGGAFGLPAWMGDIKALAFQQNVTSGTGLGALIVFAENGVSSFAVQNARSTWNTIDISRVLFQDNGGTGPANVTPINSDLFYLSPDGLKTLRLVSSQEENALTVSSLYQKIKSFMDDDTTWAYQFASATLADNRLYITSIARKNLVTNPLGEEVENFYFDGLVTIDLLNISGSPMVYEGITTGCRFLQVFEVERFGKSQLVCFGLGNDFEMNFYTQDKAEYLDNRVSRPECRVYTRAMDFGSKTVQKKYAYAELWLSDVKGIVDMNIYYRPEGYALWTLGGKAQIVAKDASDENVNVYPQIRQKIRISEESLGLSPEISELRNLLIGTKIEFCIDWTGHCQIDRALFVVDPQPDDVRIDENEGTNNFALTGDALMDYDYVA